MLTFITRGGEGRGKTNKKRKATVSKGSGLEEGPGGDDDDDFLIDGGLY